MREYKTVLQTNNGRAQQRTPLINGQIDCIELILDEYAEIQITYKDWIIFSQWLQAGKYYLPIMTEGITPDMKKLNYSSTRIIVNGSLIIKIRGSLNNKLDVIIRWREI